MVKVNRRVRWHYTTTILRLRIGADCNCIRFVQICTPHLRKRSDAQACMIRMLELWFYKCIMSVSSIVPEKSRGNKKRHEEEELRHIFGCFGITVKWPWHGCMQLFLYLHVIYVHTVEDSTLMSIFDQFRFSFVFLGLSNIGPIAILKTPSGSISFSLIFGYDATASSIQGFFCTP